MLLKSNGKTKELLLYGYSGKCNRCNKIINSYAKLTKSGGIAKWVDKCHHETKDHNDNKILLCIQCNAKINKPVFKESIYNRVKSFQLLDHELAQSDFEKVVNFISEVWNDEVINFYKKLPYELFLKTNYWIVIRTLINRKYDNKCAICGRESNLETHHLKYDNRGNEHCHLEDLILLCMGCHRNIHELKSSYSIENMKKLIEVMGQ